MIGRAVFDYVLFKGKALTDGALRHATDRALLNFKNRYRHKDGGFRWIPWVATPKAT